MGLSILPVGGYGEVGKNCTAIMVDDEIYLLDLGLHLENYVRVSEDDDLNYRLSKKLLIREGAAPDISLIDKSKVKAILISHAHLDHVGAVPFLANSFHCDLYGTPFTMELARKLVQDKKTELLGHLNSVEYGKIIKLSDKVSIEFVEVTHSTPHSAAIVLHTPYGVIVYLNDFKLDDKPTLGNITNLKRLIEVKPKILIINTLYGDVDSHTPGEEFAKKLLEDALLSRDLTGRNVLVTTFASQIAHIHTLVSIAQKMNRKVMIIGRSMAKYLEAAHEVGLSDVIDKHEVVRYSSKARKALRGVGNFKEYLFIVTGGLAEPKAVLTRIVGEELIPLKRGDLIVFSNKVIPTPTIISAREKLEHKLIGLGYEVLRDLHVSGHGAARDHKTILEALKPEIILPLHGDDEAREAFEKLAHELGFKDVRLLVNSERLDI